MVKRNPQRGNRSCAARRPLRSLSSACASPTQSPSAAIDLPICRRDSSSTRAWPKQILKRFLGSPPERTASSLGTTNQTAIQTAFRLRIQDCLPSLCEKTLDARGTTTALPSRNLGARRQPAPRSTHHTPSALVPTQPEDQRFECTPTR